MTIANDVSCSSASVDAEHTVCIDMPEGEDKEAVRLMFEILGWQLIVHHAGDGKDESGHSRLRLYTDGALVRVVTNDEALAVVLARNGLDRLPLPVALPALEQLMVVAG